MEKIDVSKPHEAIQKVQNIFGQKSLIAYVNAIQAILTATKQPKQTIREFENYLQMQEDRTRAHLPTAITDDLNTTLITIFKSFALLYGTGNDYATQATILERKFDTKDEANNYATKEQILKLYQEIIEHTLHTETKNNNKKKSSHVLLTRQHKTQQPQKLPLHARQQQFEILRTYTCQTCLSNNHTHSECPERNSKCNNCQGKHTTQACAQYYNPQLQHKNQTTNKPHNYYNQQTHDNHDDTHNTNPNHNSDHNNNTHNNTHNNAHHQCDGISLYASE